MMPPVQLLALIGFAIGLSAAVYLREVCDRPAKDWGEFVLASVAFALLAGEYLPAHSLAIPDDAMLSLAVALLIVAEVVAFYAALDD